MTAGARFFLRFDTDNAAFGETDDELTDAIARTLRRIADAIQRDGVPYLYENIQDDNGNIVGGYALKDEHGENLPNTWRG